MILPKDLPASLPLFPLAGALLLPRGHLPLHLFEPRYLAMMDDALTTPGRLIGMVQPLGDGLHNVGCAGRITSFIEAEDGRYMITLTGISRFQIAEEIAGDAPYTKGDVSWRFYDRDLGAVETDPRFKRDGFLTVLDRYLTLQELQTDWENLQEADDEAMINGLSMLCPFSPEDKQALLEAPSLTARREMLEALMDFALRSVDGEGMMQ